MAEFRQIHTRIWKDDWFSDLEPDAKLLFVYLFSNEQAEVSGLYELPIKYMAFESGLTKDRTIQLIKQFEKAGKVFYRNGWVWVVHLRKYNETGSDKVDTRIKRDIDRMPSGELKEMYCKYHGIPYRYPIDTPSIPFHTETETDTEKETISDSAAQAPQTPPSTEPQAEPKPKKHRQLSEKELHALDLQSHFLGINGNGKIQPPKHETKAQISSWWAAWGNPLLEILSFTQENPDDAKALIERTVTKLHRDGMTVGDPRSILKTARSIASEVYGEF